MPPASPVTGRSSVGINAVPNVWFLPGLKYLSVTLTDVLTNDDPRDFEQGRNPDS